jgi:hypothetical protein
MEGSKTEEYRRGVKVAIALGILTALEFWVASMANGPIPYPVMCGLLAPITWFAIWASRSPLMFFALAILIKAGLIINYYMHLNKVLSEVG